MNVYSSSTATLRLAWKQRPPSTTSVRLSCCITVLFALATDFKCVFTTGRAPAKPSSADYYALEPDEAFYDEPAQASSNPINNTETRPEATREPSSSTSPAPFPAPQDHQSSVPASSSSSSKRPHQDVHLDLELEDEAELDALAAQTAAPAKKPRLAQDLRGPYESDHPFQSGLDSYATANINLGTSRNALAPVQAKTFDGQPITLTRRLPQMMQVRSFPLSPF